jgi:hypothetical protein
VETDAAAQLKVTNTGKEISCYTNHFQHGRSASWSRTKESERRLTDLRDFAQKFSWVEGRRASMSNLRTVEDSVRYRAARQ